MDSTEILKSEGWQLSDDGWNKVTENNSITSKNVIEKKALDTDLRELGGHGFPPETSLGRVESVTGPVVVQIQKIRNVSVPKSSEDTRGPRLLKVTITDGTQVCQALEYDKINFISINTPPGTKLRLKGDIEIANGYLLLDPANTDLLGGHVSHLVDKWKLNRTLAKYTRGRYGEGGPPPWIPFGQKITTNLNDKDFKSLGDQDKENKEGNDEFESLRRDAIAEAGKGFVRRVFGGGNRPLLDKNVQIIVEEGFTVQQAEHALKQARNDVKKALRSLQKRTGRGGAEDKRGGDKDGAVGGAGGAGGGGGGGGSGRRKKSEEDVPHKPSGPVSLFDFLEEKLPLQHGEKEFGGRDGGVGSGGGGNRNYGNGEMSGGRGNSSRGRGGGHRGSNRGGSNSQQHHHTIGNFIAPSNQLQTGSKKHQQHKSSNSSSTHSNNVKGPRFSQQSGGKQQNSSVMFNNSSVSFGQYNNNKPLGNAEKSNGPMPDGFPHSRNNTFYDNFHTPHKNDIFGHRNSFGGEMRNHNSNHFKPPGMPDIPEFPFKDTSFIPPLMSANTLGLFQDFNEFSRNEKWRWKVGDMCMAKYWEDNRYYDAEVTGVSNKTCVVRFLEYGNYEEVVHEDCIPVTDDGHHHRGDGSHDDNNFNHSYSGGSGRRDGNKRGVARTRAVYVPPPGRPRHHYNK